MPEYCIGVTGGGATRRNHTLALVTDLLKQHADDRVVWVLDGTLTHGALSPAVAIIYKWAVEEEYPVEIVVPSERKGRTIEQAYAEVLKDATQEHFAANPPATVARRSDVLLIAWSDDDQTSMPALLAAEKAGIKALDLTEGLLELSFEDDAPTERGEPEIKAEPDTPSDTQVPASDVRSDLGAARVNLGSLSERITAEIDGHADADFFEEFARMVARTVVDELKPFLPAKRAPGRPRKTGPEE